MDTGLPGILPPDGVVLLHVDAADPVQCHHVKVTDRLIVLRRISRCHDDPPLRHFAVPKHLALEELEHGRGQRLGDTVYLVDKEDALGKAGLLHLVVDRCDDLAHGVLCDRIGLSAIDLLPDKGEADGALPGVVGDGVGHKPDPALSGDLFHDLRLTYARRAHEKDGPLPDSRYHVLPIGVLFQIGLYGVPDFLFGSFYIHAVSPFSSGSLPDIFSTSSFSSTSLMAQGGTSLSS